MCVPRKMNSELKQLESQIESSLKTFALGLGNRLLEIVTLVARFNTNRELFKSYLMSEFGLSLQDADLAIAIAQEARMGKYNLLASSSGAIFEMMAKMVEKESPEKASDFGAVKNAFLNS